MKFQISNFKSQIGAGMCSIILLTAICLLPAVAVSAADWSGVDESVVEKYAEEYGRAARDPYINTDQGDLLLFVFLLAGTAGGFLGGYYWRELMEKKPRNSEHRRDVA